MLVTVSALKTPPDFDNDGDIDQTDFSHFQICLTGSGFPITNPNCLNTDLNGDTHVDEQDVTIFLRCMRGPDVAADPHCTD